MKTEIHLSRFEACHPPARQRETANSSRWNGNFSTVPSAPLFFIAWKSNCRFLSVFPSTDPRFLRVSSIFCCIFPPLFFLVVNADSSVSLGAGYPAVTGSNSTGIYKFFQGSFPRIRTVIVPFFFFFKGFFLGNVRVYICRGRSKQRGWISLIEGFSQATLQVQKWKNVFLSYNGLHTNGNTVV